MKQIKHSIGGEDRTLDVGKMWFTKFFGEATSSDPMYMSELLNQPDKQFDFICGLVYGGLNCYNKTNGIKDLISLEQVQDWVGCMDQSDAAELIGKFADSNKSFEKGEAPAQAVNP